MSADIKTLLEAQSDIHGRMSRSVDNLRKMGVSNIIRGAIQARVTILDNLWSKIESQHEFIRAALKERYSESEYAKSDFIDIAESTYVTQRSTLLEYAEKLKIEAPSAPKSEPGQEHAPKTALPRIKLPTFSGAYEDWPSFRDLFLSVVGENSSISSVERFHYLRSCVKGPAEKLIRSLTVTGENYDRAWAILEKHYENKRELMRLNFTTFTAVGKMKCESAEELSRVHHAVTATVNAQESIGRPINTHGMDLLNHLVVELFDSRTRLEWESSTSDSTDPPNHEVLIDFISKRILTLNAAKPRITTKSAGETSRSAKSHSVKNGFDSSKCAACEGKHSLMHCPEFKSKSASERKSFVEASRLCFNCLGNHVMAKCQSVKTCFTCKSRHHTLLHDAYATPSPKLEASTFSTTRTSHDQMATLLATARVTLTDRVGRPHDVRALLDQGSEVSLVSEDLAQRLRLPRTRSSLTIIGVGGAHPGSTRSKITLALKSRVTGASLTVVAYVLPRLSGYQGPSTKGSSAWPHLHGLTLADPQYLQRDPINLLLGADVFSNILLDGLRKGTKDQLIAQRTTFGWILSGGCGITASNGSFSSLQCTIDHDLNALVQRFWEQEREQPASVALTPDEERCEEIFTRTHERSADGKYTVRLPLNGPLPPLDETRRSAVRLLTAMERRRSRDADFNQLYRNFMEEYSDLKHMSLVKTPLTQRRSVCYLPHHGVLRTSSTTTKLRVVFNGSQCTPAGDSLNNCVLVGANLLPTLADILLRWRWHRFVFIADIEKMYRQILVHPDDRDLQRILWRRHSNDDVQEYQLNTVTYGMACAPFLAIRTLRQLADDGESANPKGAVALRRDCYVDDIVTGASTLSEAVETQRQLRRLCTAGGFPLRKWASNYHIILQDIPREHRLQQPHHDWEDEAHPTLGLRWHPRSDAFTFRLQPRVSAPLTKRQALSETARIFDPLGWLTRAKILIQSAWMKHLDWDSPLPQSDEVLWRRLFEELPLLEQLKLNRWLAADDQASHVELHGFADASERGYAAAVYLRVVGPSSTATSLLAAKSKVAPIKPVSVPRLELCAAALLTNLTFHLRKTLDLISAPVTLWSDSRVALQWIQGHASKWKTFVANRVSHIQTKLPEARWRHIPGGHNPADCASRGIEPRALLNHSLWWTGPPWLSKDPYHWPQSDHARHEVEAPETRAIASNLAIADKVEPEMLLRFSDLHRLLRVTAWCCRWRGHPPNSKAHPSLTPDELETALLRWIRLVQAIHLSKEIATLKQKRPIVKSQLTKLSPFLDDQGIMRVGGQLKHAVLSEDERHPMILSAESWMTRLLVRAHHKRTLHGGVQLTLGLLRLRYWIPRGRSIVKALIHRCVTCAKWRAAVPQPMMSHLPTARLTPSRPFLRTGVDYAGPILIRTGKGRGYKSHKGFIAVFVCFTTRAVHLEAASDYSADAFLAAFRRFTSRRDLCEEVYSDCGTNFVGASKELRRMFQASSSDGRRIAHAAASDGIRWRFNPPAAPHFGGLWEAAVKSTKHHLRRVLGDATLTFEEMATFLAQVEACLNSRPLQALTDDPDDVTALTPGHFLIGVPLLALPEPSLADSNRHLLPRWKLLQQMRDYFWERWSREYVNSLASRPKWLKDSVSPTVGALCLLRADATPPTRWPLARIVELHPGDDGVTRVVTIRTASSELIRPLIKLVLLPGADSSSFTPPSDS